MRWNTVLHDVLGGEAVSGHFPEIAVERTMMALEEFTEGVELAVANSQHQRVVGLVG